VRPARNAYDRLGHVIASAPTPAAVDGALDTALAAVRLEIEDEPPAGGR
ncbi:hypothetical protein, partial [Streptomyces acidiscabies]